MSATRLTSADQAAPAGGLRRVSIAGVLFGTMLSMCAALIALGWHAIDSVNQVLETEERLQSDHAAQQLQERLRLEAGRLSASAFALAHHPRHLEQQDTPQTLAHTQWLMRERLAADVDALAIVDSHGRELLRAGGMGELSTTARTPLSGLVLRDNGWWLVASAAIPSAAGERVLAERFVSANYLRESLGARSLDAALYRGEEAVASTVPMRVLSERLGDLARTNAGGDGFVELEGSHDAYLRRVQLGPESLLLVLMIPESEFGPVAVGLRRIGSAWAVVTVVIGLLAAGLLARTLTVPVRAITDRALALSQQYAGRHVQPRANELDTLVEAFDAMTGALVSHTQRLKQAHVRELQHAFEQSRQNAQLRLLRGVAAAVAENDRIEDALRASLDQLGEYFGDWPLARAALLCARDLPPRQTFWRCADETRFASFMAAADAIALMPSARQLMGRAYLAGVPTWVADLTKLQGWNRLALAQQAGLKSAFVIPVMVGGHATAFIEFFCDVEVAPSAELLELLDTVADELSRLAERDLAARKLSESRERARRLAVVAESTDNFVLLLTQDGRIDWVNDATLRRCGVQLTDIVGQLPHRALGAESDDARDRAALEIAIAQRRPCRIDMALTDADGETIVFEAEGQPLTNERGDFVNYALVGADVTERRRAEMQLRDSAAYFHALFDESPVAMTIQDADLRLVRVNQAWARLFGYRPDEVLGTDPLIRMHPDEVAGARQRRDEVLRPNSASLRFECRMLTKAGDTIWINCHASRIVDASGSSFFLGVIDDVTQAREERAALEQAKNLAESASRAKSQFLATMSHEIRTPMNGVLGMTELLLGTSLNAKQRRFAEAVYRSGETLLEIINDILDLSKIEAGKLDIERLDFNPRLLLEDVLEMLAPRAHERRLELLCHVDAQVPITLNGDASRLRQVLVNLVSNAIKFTERGEVIVAVSTSTASGVQGKCSVCFEVRDTGIGISADLQGRLFQPFTQGDQSMTRRFGGTGLGLAISKQLVEMMGGRISFASTPGTGSVFRFDVPLGYTSGEPASAPAAASLAGRDVLLVEDNAINRNVIGSHLHRFGMKAAAATNGREGLELLRAAADAGRRFDVAVIDMKMPVMDGRALIAEIHGDARLCQMPVVLLTSTGDHVEADAGGGHLLQLSKPVRQTELKHALEQALGATQKGPVPTDDHPSLVGVRVLLAEDNPVNQEVVRTMLAQSGCQIAVAGDGAAALELLASQRFDAVLMDCQMPGVDGYSVVRSLRAGPPQRYATTVDVPIVAVTANALSGDAERCIAAGFSAYLSKPIRQSRLLETLHQWIGAPRSRETNRSADRIAVRQSDAGGQRGANAPVAEVEATEIDVVALDRIRAMQERGATGLLQRLVDMFADNSNRLLEQGQKALADRDADGLLYAAHTLKSSSGNLGAVALSSLCLQVESLARAADLAAAEPLWTQAQSALVRALQHLRQFSSSSAAEHAAAESIGVSLR